MAALPNVGLTAERFTRVAMTCVTQNPMLQECDPKTIAIGVIRSAQLGLSLDPILGEAYLIPRWNGKKKQMEANFQRGYRGIQKLIRRTGELSGFRGDLVREKDKFLRTANGDIFHERARGDRGKITDAYVVMYFKDGFVLAYDMPIEDVYAIRDRYSEGYKAFVAGKIKDNPWDPGNPIAEKWMVIKTVLFQAAHLAPMETEAGQQLVKEAVREELPADQAMDELSAELFEGDEPITLERTTERLSRTDSMTQQLGAGSADSSTSNEAKKQADTPEKSAGERGEPSDWTMTFHIIETVAASEQQANEYISEATGDRFRSINDLMKNGSAEDWKKVQTHCRIVADSRDKKPAEKK